jgi:hypothetical protein
MNSTSAVTQYKPYNAVPVSPAVSDDTVFSKNNVIIFLLVIVILSFLGINMLIVSGNVLAELTKIFGPVVQKVASMLGYSAGHLVNATADITADTAKLGVDIAEGTVQSVGNLLKNASKGGMDESERKSLEIALSSPRCPTCTSSPQPSQTADTIHRSISAKKSGWCFVGEDAGMRGCISVDEHDKCLSGQIFTSRDACMNPVAK